MNPMLMLGGGSLLHQVSRELTTAVDQRLAAFDLTVQQGALLVHAATGDASPRQLADLVGTDTAGMTRLLDRLERKDLIRRRPHDADRRSVVIELTDAGQALAPKLPPVFGDMTRKMLAGFDETELHTLTAMLRRMQQNLTSPT